MIRIVPNQDFCNWVCDYRTTSYYVLTRYKLSDVLIVIFKCIFLTYISKESKYERYTIQYKWNIINWWNLGAVNKTNSFSLAPNQLHFHLDTRFNHKVIIFKKKKNFFPCILKLYIVIITYQFPTSIVSNFVKSSIGGPQMNRTAKKWKTFRSVFKTWRLIFHRSIWKNI